ncbi:MAG TPA: bacillithiol biosynthesis cysteine-adding enzyme BshC [Vicinamibacterales bacterium]|nr:bacillithiol biosynthesis cysteine-adding enzyme BshC [Vicinamibacterales bacterium]
MRRPIDIRRFPWIRRLAADYAFDYERLSDFFAGNPASPSAWREALARTSHMARPRDRVADIVERQQARRQTPPEAVRATARLRDPRTVAVVTGQQAGLFGGPLFTLLKALTAIRLAERVTAEHGVPAVPIFWIDAEDHDWDEVKVCGVLDRDLALRHVAVGDPPGANERPVARVSLDASVSAAVDELERTLQPTEFTDDLIDRLRGIYQPGAGMVDAFARWLEAMLGSHGLVVYDAADPAAKPLAAELFAREIDGAGQTARLAAEAGAALEARGYHAQATPHEASLALFELDGSRQPIRVRGDRFVLGERHVSKAELLERVRARPEAFSPNVLLRPLVQDTLFPTVCYVAGPNELAYLGQLRRVYEAFGVPMPIVQPRATATIVDANAMRFLTRHDLPLEALRAQDEAALNALLEAQLPPNVDRTLDEARRAVEAQLARVADEVRPIDPTLEGAVRSTLGRMEDDLRKLHAKIVQAAKRKDETLRRQYRHAQAQAFPGGQPQERAVGSVYFLNKYGPVFIDRLRDELSLDAGMHWVITI